MQINTELINLYIWYNNNNISNNNNEDYYKKKIHKQQHTYSRHDTTHTHTHTTLQTFLCVVFQIVRLKIFSKNKTVEAACEENKQYKEKQINVLCLSIKMFISTAN